MFALFAKSKPKNSLSLEEVINRNKIIAMSLALVVFSSTILVSVQTFFYLIISSPVFLSRSNTELQLVLSFYLHPYSLVGFPTVVDTAFWNWPNYVILYASDYIMTLIVVVGIIALVIKLYDSYLLEDLLSFGPIIFASYQYVANVMEPMEELGLMEEGLNRNSRIILDRIVYAYLYIFAALMLVLVLQIGALFTESTKNKIRARAVAKKAQEGGLIKPSKKVN